ncbi:alpha/beta hydrolase [Variovorax sp. PCZ-1]|uniref:alpha/beta hydrolase n=1 Tax=Variovorax sp. PCZ-1 TaxID=2835533 RepID=UPI001BCAA7CA|nr:alpha/beta hydrolase [Variovorax sp. PCZ-1]MBS7808327.1 alpha/beta hydrolase [Variovorax sp. PCZ-1]
MESHFSFQNDPAYLDSQFNNRLRVPEFATHFQRWQADSAVARNSQACHLSLPYSHGGAAETLDVFPAEDKAKKAPVLVFIHGGYWRSLDKADHSFVAPAFTQEGACVVIPNYPLCPAVTMEQLVLTQVQALAWVYRNIAQYGGDPQRISVIGHSAGGHLAAMLLACVWKKFSADLPKQLVRNALSLSGLHDLAPIMHSPYLQGDLRLTEQQVQRCSPAYFPAPQGQLTALCGDDESDEFKRQNRLIQQAWDKSCVPVCETVPGKNHFSVLEALCTPGQRTHDLALDLLAK